MSLRFRHYGGPGTLALMVTHVTHPRRRSKVQNLQPARPHRTRDAGGLFFLCVSLETVIFKAERVCELAISLPCPLAALQGHLPCSCARQQHATWLF